MTSITYEIDPAEKMVYITFPEEIDLKSSLKTMYTLEADERLGKDFYILVNLQATKSIPSFGEARVIADIASSPALFLHHPTALVVSRPIQYGIGNMISVLATLKGAIVQTFYEVEEAKQWLLSLRS